MSNETLGEAQIIDLASERSKRRPKRFDTSWREAPGGGESEQLPNQFYLLDIPQTELFSLQARARAHRGILGRVGDLFSMFHEDVYRAIDPNKKQAITVESLHLEPRPGLAPTVNSIMINRVPDDKELPPTSPRRRVEIIINHRFLSNIDTTTVTIDHNPREEDQTRILGREILDISPFLLNQQGDALVYTRAALERERAQRTLRREKNGSDRDLTLTELNRLNNLLSDVVRKQP